MGGEIVNGGEIQPGPLPDREDIGIRRKLPADRDTSGYQGLSARGRRGEL